MKSLVERTHLDGLVGVQAMEANCCLCQVLLSIEF